MGKDEKRKVTQEDASDPPTTIYQDVDSEADHIRANNEASLSPTPLSPIVPVAREKDHHKTHKHHKHKHHHHHKNDKEKHKDKDMKSPRPSGGEKTPRTTPRKSKDLKTTPASDKARRKSSSTSAMPPAVPNLAEILTDEDAAAKMPHREARRRRGEESSVEESGFLEDLEENNGGSNNPNNPIVPGAVRIHMDGNSTDDQEQDNLDAALEKNGAASRKEHGDGSVDRDTTAPDAATSSEMRTLPQAEFVTEAAIDEKEREELMKNAEKDAEKAFLANVATAEMLGDEKELQMRQARQNKTRVWIVLGLVLLVLVGVVVGVILGTRNKSSNEAPAEVIDPSTFVNITSTEDVCENAIEIEYPTIVTGSTVDATADNTDFNVCGKDVTAVGDFGVWYKLRGNGNPLSLSTCFGSGFDTQISIYSGVDCPSVACVVGNDQRTSCGTDGSHATFLAEDGTQYFILVHGLRRSSGVFTLVIDEVVDNSQCSIATTIEDSNPEGEVVVLGSTRFSELDNSLESCQEKSIASPGVWYKFVPQSTRFVQARLDDLAGTVTVYSGEACDSLQCVTADSAGMAMWTATQGAEYVIFVHADGKMTGDFALSILPGGLLRPPEETNNQCILNERLDTPSVQRPINTTGNTDDGLIADKSLGCGDLFDASASPSLWYSVVGNGNGLRASTCDTDSGFVAQVVVYEGDCENLLCIDGEDQNCEGGSAVAWIGGSGKQYFVLVEGLESRTGEFNLTLTETIPRSSSDCYNPQEVPLDGVAILGSTEDGSVQDVGLCTGSFLSSPSVWYSVKGTGEVMVASTCNVNSNVFAKLELYRGSCDSLECDEAEKITCGNQMSLTWISSLEETYLLQVYGSGVPGNGDFTLHVEEHPANHSCSEAKVDLVAGSSVQGSVVRSGSIDASGCSLSDEYGAWYRINAPADETMSLSVCSSVTNFEAKVTLFQGSSCGQLACIGTNNGVSCGNGSFLTWDASSFEQYYVLVIGSDPYEIGNFELSFGIQNDICETAIGQINPGGNSILGSTVLATVDDGHGDLGCFPPALPVVGPGVWYTVRGTSSLLKATTCSYLTNFDTQISVYEGDCGNLICIAGNDNDEECDDSDSSSAIWFGEQAVTYFVLVHGADTGRFALKVTEIQNDSCSEAYEIFRPGASETVLSERFTSQTFIEPCSGDVSTNQIGAWYSIAGTGEVILLDACGSAGVQSQGTRLSVYSDGCTSLNCEADVEDDCNLVVETNFGEDYTVYLETISTDLGFPLELDVYANNDRCNSAFGPLKQGDIVRGSTADASLDTVPLCGLSARGPGVWYTLIGTGETATIFTCSEFTDFDTQITLFTGGDCGSLECVASRDDNCGTATWMTHPFQDGNLYYVLVSGKPGPSNTGNYELHVQ
ncbi:MAG: hypothetical protein SGILL_001802 [Bacillariaceae sp.]